jgi:arabinogalactan oligomer/maltooligosaccharide transport system permease protein
VLGLLLLGLAVPVANRAATGRWQWLASGAGLALAAVACGVLLAGYDAWVGRAPDTTGAGGLLTTGLALGVPGGGVGYLWGALTLLVLGLPVLAWRGTGHRAATALREHRVAMAYIVPAALGMIVLVLVPFAVGIVLGFFNHCEGRYEYVGLANFTDILSGGGTSVTDPLNFWFTLGVTLMWTTLNVALHVCIGLGLALLLKDPLLRGKGVYRVLLILPWAVPNYITALMWKGMFHQQFGAVNQLLGVFGFEQVSWFSHFWTSFTANLVTNTWLGFPFMMVVTLGALQSIPRDLYEAAEVDGASRWYQFSRITLPLLKPALLPAVILGAIWTFNMFNVIYLVSAGEPAGSTDILITEAYRWAFIRHERYGLAAAYATLIFLILLAYSLLTNRVARGAEGTFD